jgi:hypothetical protein
VACESVSGTQKERKREIALVLHHESVKELSLCNNLRDYDI